MKRTLIISTLPLSINSNTAIVNICKFLQKNLEGVELTDNPLIYQNEYFDNIIISYGSYYCDYKSILSFLEKNKDKRIFYLVNEYGLIPNGDIYKFLRENGYELIANYEETCRRKPLWYKKFHKVNLNAIGLLDLDVYDFRKDKNFVYWGRYRENREVYFRKYFKGFDILTNKKEEFSEFIKDNNVYEVNVQWNTNCVLKEYRYTVYIEDLFTHANYNHLAQRFYEAISFNIIPFFDINCIFTLKKSNYPLDYFYIVRDRKDLDRFCEQDYTKDYCFEELRKIARRERDLMLLKMADILGTRVLSYENRIKEDKQLVMEV